VVSAEDSILLRHLRSRLGLVVLSEQSDCQTLLSSSSSSANPMNVIFRCEWKGYERVFLAA
jgi:hypothetical protein